MKSIVPLLTGAAAGFVVSYVPYGYFILPGFIVLTIILAARRGSDKNFRGSGADEWRTMFFAVFWIAVAIFYAVGLNTFIPKMNARDEKVGKLLEEWREIHPNVVFECDNSIAEKQITIHTITRINLKDALKLIEEKADAKTTCKRNIFGRSIAGGPRITVEIHPGKSAGGKSAGGTDHKPRKPVFNDVQ
jgi:hypothetical protein